MTRPLCRCVMLSHCLPPCCLGGKIEGRSLKFFKVGKSILSAEDISVTSLENESSYEQVVMYNDVCYLFISMSVDNDAFFGLLIF